MIITLCPTPCETDWEYGWDFIQISYEMVSREHKHSAVPTPMGSMVRVRMSENGTNISITNG